MRYHHHLALMNSNRVAAQGFPSVSTPKPDAPVPVARHNHPGQDNHFHDGHPNYYKQTNKDRQLLGLGQATLSII